jgi:hypothetical protein
MYGCVPHVVRLANRCCALTNVPHLLVPALVLVGVQSLPNAFRGSPPDLHRRESDRPSKPVPSRDEHLHATAE